jgi:hypothetical protein
VGHAAIRNRVINFIKSMEQQNETQSSSDPNHTGSSVIFPLTLGIVDDKSDFWMREYFNPSPVQTTDYSSPP